MGFLDQYTDRGPTVGEVFQARMRLRDEMLGDWERAAKPDRTVFTGKPHAESLRAALAEAAPDCGCVVSPLRQRNGPVRRGGRDPRGDAAEGGGVKYAEFAALCEREFADGGGDVVALNLTGPSAAELAGDILGSPDVPQPLVLPAPADVPAEVATAVTAGAAATRVINPMTHSTVRVVKDADRDTATVVTRRIVALG